LDKPLRNNATLSLVPRSVQAPLQLIRERVLKAAFTLFRQHGFSNTSMLDIVTQARVSKRDLYALFNNKQQS
jgi:AcrR family transcriptional regulator